MFRYSKSPTRGRAWQRQETTGRAGGRDVLEAEEIGCRGEASRLRPWPGTWRQWGLHETSWKK